MIKAVLFDFGQTLVDSADGFRAAEKEAQIRIFNDLGCISWEEFLVSYRRIREEYHNSSIFSRIAIWQEVYKCCRCQSDILLLEKFEYDYWKKVTAETILFPETERVLEILASRYLLALVTNTQGQRESPEHRFFDIPNLEPMFKVVIIAGESGISPKPDSAPFLLCLEKLGLEPAEAVFVGDDWHIDICGAQNAGIQPIWLKYHTVARTWPDVETSVPVITSLDQLLNLNSILV